MDWYWIVGIGFVVVAILAIALRGNGNPKRASLFRLHEALFTPAERSFLGVLDQACAGRYRVFGKVRVADVIAPAKGLDKGTWTSAFNRIKAKHFDFVLCCPQTLGIKAVIELNDKSHSRHNRIQRDEFVGRACADAGLALRSVKAQRNYSMDEVRQIVDAIDVELRTDP